MRLIRRHGKAMLLHQQWKLKAAGIIGAAMVATIVVVETCVHTDRLFNLSAKLGYDAKEAVTVINDTPSDNMGRRLGFYPNDEVIGKFDSAGNVNWETGEYKNAPAARKIGIIVHIIGCMYMLVGLNTVCDIYFCGALDEMVEKWQIQPDVAGATFMAAGGSAPELFTSLIGAVGVESDVGFGCIVGSAVFNVLAVIGACGMAAEAPIKLTWWPLFRDCTFYIMGLCVLAIFAYGASIKDPKSGKWIGGGAIELYEAIILFCLYLLYVLIMVFNAKLNNAAQGLVDKFGKKDSKVAPAAAADEVKASPEEDLKKTAEGDAAPSPPEHHTGASGGDAAPAAEGAGEPAKAGGLAVPGAGEGEAVPMRPSAVNNPEHPDHHKHVHDRYLRRVHHKCHASHPHHEPHTHSPSAVEGGAAPINVEPKAATDAAAAGGEAAAGAAPAADGAAAEEKKEEGGGDGGSEESEDDILALVKMPSGSMADKISWVLCLPIYAALYFCIPRPSPKWFLATFGVALIFIAGFSYWLVYFIEMFGNAILGGGNSITIVLSFTLLAAGTSIPDLVSSMAVARAGEGDMAVSSSIGSNIFDILVGLPLPWVLKIGVVEMGINGKSDYGVRIKSPYIALYVFLLLFMVGMVITSILCNGWYLNKKLGVMMSVLYFIFLCIVLPMELIDPVNA